MLEKMIIGIDLGGTKINTVLADRSGSIKARDQRDTLAQDGPGAVIERIVESIRSVTAESEIGGIGIGAAGACDTKRGIVTHSPNLLGWYNIPLRNEIQRYFDVPTYLENDAPVAALGESPFGGC